MWSIVYYAKHNNTQNGDLSSFNCIKWSSFVGSDDAVETFERHAEYEEGPTQGASPEWHSCQDTVPFYSLGQV